MTTTTKSKTVNFCGDEISVNWTGSVWTSPSNGRQHSSVRNAMMDELLAYCSAGGSGDEYDDLPEHLQVQIENALDSID